MGRFAALVAYDGGAYEGFQRQAPHHPTVQAALEAALERIFGQAVAISGAGRTDTGVHALGQVIAFSAEWPHHPYQLLKALNQALPKDVAIQALQAVPDTFHPRFGALARRYRYQVLVCGTRQPLLWGQTWQIGRGLSLERLNEAAHSLIGEHDFASFGHAPHGENTVRMVYESVWQEQEQAQGHLYTYTIEATAFLHHMVRRIVAVSVAVGLGRLTQETFLGLFHQARVIKSFPLAPPQGLYLVGVRYPDLTWDTVYPYDNELGGL